MKITEKQRNFILKNLDILESYQLEEIIEKIGIDNLDKEYASELINNIIEVLDGIEYMSYEDLY